MNQIWIYTQILILWASNRAYSASATPSTNTDNNPESLHKQSNVAISGKNVQNSNVHSSELTKILQPVGRNMPFPSSYEDDVQLPPMPYNFNSVPRYRDPIINMQPSLLPFDPYPLDAEDSMDTALTRPYQPIMTPHPLDDVQLNYPSEMEKEVIVPVGRQIVFRPLFAYKHKISQKRRIYTYPTSSSRSYRYDQNRRSGYSYRSYPDYYANAPYDYVA